MQKTLFALSLGFGLAILAQAAKAQNIPCGERAKIIQGLTEKYGETRQVIGLARNNRIMELYASTETGSWTLVVTLPDGRSCLLATGDSYEYLNGSKTKHSSDA